MSRPPIDHDTLAPGMRRQLARLEAALADGMPRRGWKVGINVPEVRAHLGLAHAAVAWIDGRRVLDSGDVLACDPDARLLVEPEIAIGIDHSLSPDATTAAAREAISWIRPALEIVDYGRPPEGLEALVAGCILHHATVLGDVHPLTAAPDPALGRDCPRLRVGVRDAGAPRGDLVPGDPGEIVSFVARYLEAFGAHLEAGDLILAGSYLPQALAITAGEEAIADYGKLGRVSVRAVSTRGAASPHDRPTGTTDSCC